MIALDVEYSQRRSLWLNLSILARTVPAVLGGKGRVMKRALSGLPTLAQTALAGRAG